MALSEAGNRLEMTLLRAGVGKPPGKEPAGMQSGEELLWS